MAFGGMTSIKPDSSQGVRITILIEIRDRNQLLRYDDDEVDLLRLER